MPDRILSLLDHARSGGMLADDDIHLLAEQAPLAALLGTAEAMTLAGHGRSVGYSRKVFIPLTRLCRNTCGYCTFATTPGRVPSAYLSADEVLAIARAGVAAGCHEALFTLGERPESRYRAARDALAALGHDSTIGYLAEMAALVQRETGLLPHVNPGTMDADEIALLRPMSASMGIMLESSSTRLCERGGPHWKCEDKLPGVRLDTLRRAGELGVPMTTGILIGIGETRRERIDSLLALRELHRRYGHLQEIIVQNFRAKPGTVMAGAEEPALDDHAWTIAMARLVFGAAMSIQAPPNLRPGELEALLRAGINDWGGISPVTLDHVNPEAAWPQIDALAAETALHGRQLRLRLPLVPSYVREAARWVPAPIATALLRRADASGFARPDDWLAGTGTPPSAAALQPFARRAAAMSSTASAPVSAPLRAAIERAEQGRTLGEDDIVRLFDAHGDELHAVIDAADRLRRQTVGEAVSHVRNCNINYTNICQHRCGFCAFAKSHAASTLRGPAYRLDAAQVAARAEEAWLRGATEVCMQGGIHPHYTGDSYLELLAAVKQATPAMHIHAFSPLEIRHGAATLGLPLRDYLIRLRDAGLRTLPGTAAEILDDEVRALICADKLDTAQWLEVMEIAHEVGIRSTATIMFGHVEEPRHWARHLLAIRALQARTGGFTEFVPLPFVHMESPLWHKGGARSGPTLREAVLMHAVARLVLHPLIPNIQTSWVKMGATGAALCLQAGANDLGGTLMYESITRAAGGANGQSMETGDLRAIAASCGRPLQQRSTLYEVLPQNAAGLPLTGGSPPPDSDPRRMIALHSSA
ncbi:5-amino-6-(D-ribitylamino)uracil--L-tyrosine 4-hydroxyphenyl transferase CofH [Thauera sp.]|uniref:5-amino-6-(D-ribitylamino)uracil--L-tyrosine 4-hydroxyphenyl transferase CofH n=1 Tax=Thauera sp. TaxID=1905334 RepID=UPI0039E5A762